MKRSWPAQPRSLEQDHAGYVAQRLERYPGLYRTGLRCRQLTDGALATTGVVPLAGVSPSNVFPIEGPIGRA